MDNADGKVNSGKAMNKIYALYEVFTVEMAKGEDERYDWIFLTDIDTIISNPSIPIHLFLPPPFLSPQSLILGNQDHNGYNSGAVLFRVHPRNLDLLEWVIEKFEQMTEDRGGERKLPPSDQVVLSLALNSTEFGYQKGFYEIPQIWLNAYFLGMGEVQLRVHFVNQLKYTFRLTPAIDENFRVLREAQERLSRVQQDERGDMRSSGHGLELMDEYELAREVGERYWREAKNGIQGMRFLWD